MKKLWKTILCACILFLLVYIALEFGGLAKSKQIIKLEEEKVKESGLSICYSDHRFSEYLSAAAVEYKKMNGIEIDIKYISASDYLQQIAADSVSEEAVTPDLYIVREEYLENAFVLGIARENTSAVLTEDNFAKTALNAVEYRGKKIGYPLSFHVPCLVYRADLMEEPYSLQQLKDYDLSGFAESGMEHSIDLNTGSVLTDYAFIGKYVNLANKSEDGRQILYADENMAVQSVAFFQSLLTGAGISPNASEDVMILGYSEGKNLSIILSSDYIELLNESAAEHNVNFRIINIPKLTDSIESCTGSYTDAVVVNGMSENQKAAAEFAEFLTCEFAENFYDKTNLYPANYNAAKSIENFDVLYEIYSVSEHLPKLLTTEDFSVRLKEVFERTANGEDPVVIVNEFVQLLRQRIDINE